MEDDEQDTNREHYEALASGDPCGYPETFVDLRRRLKGKTGEPVLVADRLGYSMRLGILRSDTPLFRKYEFGFHTGPVAKAWHEQTSDSEGPLWLWAGATMAYLVDVLGIKGASGGLPPIVKIGKAEIDAADADQKTRIAIDKMIEIASVADSDIYGRSKERELLVARMTEVDKRFEMPWMGDFDAPEYYGVVGEMALCIRRAAQLEYNHELVKKFESYLKP